MAIYHDNFEAYALGNVTNPFGTTFTPNLNLATIVADNYLPAGSKALETRRNFSVIAWTDGALHSSATLYVAVKLTDTNNTFLQFRNGNPIGGGPSESVMTLKQEADGTFSVFAPNATLVAVAAANSGDTFFHASRWYWLQVNITLTNIAGFVTLAFEVGVEGVSIMSGTVATGVAVALLPSGTAQFDYIFLEGETHWDEFTFDVLQAINTYPNPGAPKIRASTGLAEVITYLTSPNLIASTGLIELVIAGGRNRVYEA